MIRFSVSLVNGYARVFVLVSIVIVTLPNTLLSSCQLCCIQTVEYSSWTNSLIHANVLNMDHATAKETTYRTNYNGLLTGGPTDRFACLIRWLNK